MSYDDWKTRAPEEDADPFAVPCPVCTGDASAKPCSEDCDHIVERCRRERQIQSCFQASRLVIKMAKAYRDEGFGVSDVRVRTCLDRVRYYRGQIRAHRSELRARQEAA